MPYFDKFPIVSYGGERLLNITKGFKINKNVLAKDELFHVYELDAGEKPEDVANKFYQDPQDHWLVLLANQITDPFYEWYMSGTEFTEYMTDKYGSTQADIHHYVDTNTQEILTVPAGKWISDNYVEDNYVEDILINNSEAKFSHINPDNLVEVSNEEYESSINLARRTIRVLKAEYVSDIKNDLEAGFDG